MRKIAITLGVAAAVLVAGGLAWKADATAVKSGTSGLPAATKNYSPVEQTGCRGWGPMCPPGWTWRCGPWKCKCRPC
jgi:hypothetical protein